MLPEAIFCRIFIHIILILVLGLSIHIVTTTLSSIYFGMTNQYNVAKDQNPHYLVRVFLPKETNVLSQSCKKDL